MKRQTTSWMLACVMLASMMFNGQLFGQVFTGATVPEIPTTVWSGGANTGNDYKNSVYGMGGVMAVNVWDGPNAGLGWDDFGTNAGFLTFPNPTSDPDVALVEDGSNWWAIVVYYSSGTGYMCDFYKWTGSGFALSTSNLLSGCTTQLFSINVDGDITGDFVIAWDDRCAGNIQVIGGSTLLSGGPFLCNGGVSIAASGTSACYYPDITLYSMDGVTPQYGIYDLVFLDPSFQKIYVTLDKFTSLCAGVSNYNPVFSAGAPNSYYTPRIACPPAAQGTLKDWSVVVTDVSGSGYDVLGYTSFGGSIYSYNYTNGSIFTPPAISQWNKYPAISYDNNYKGIIVSWKCFYNGSPMFIPDAPIAIQCDLMGSYPNLSTGCTSEYMIVPSNNATSINSQDAISVAGRDAVNMLYTFADYNIPDIVYKQVPFANCNLRLGAHENGPEIKVFPNPFTNTFELLSSLNSGEESISLKITDAAGREIETFRGSVDAINSHASGMADRLAPGLYVLHLRTSSTAFTFRLIKQK